ncbi:MAG: abortive infection family protein [Pseudomonadota bacterium]
MNSPIVADGARETEFSRAHEIVLEKILKNWLSAKPVERAEFDVDSLRHGAALSSLYGRAAKIVCEIYQPTGYGIALMAARSVPGSALIASKCAKAYDFLRKTYIKCPSAPFVQASVLSECLELDNPRFSRALEILEDMSICSRTGNDGSRIAIHASIKDKADIWAVFENLIAVYSSQNSSRNGYGMFQESNTALTADISYATIAMCPAALDDWQKMNDRLLADPAGAMTSSRSMLESAIKWIHHQRQVDPPSNTASSGRRLKDCLKLLGGAENDFEKPGMRVMLAGMETAMQGLDEARNGMSDGHGRSPTGPQANPRIARVVVGLATTVTVFLLATYESRLRP